MLFRSRNRALQNSRVRVRHDRIVVAVNNKCRRLDLSKARKTVEAANRLALAHEGMHWGYRIVAHLGDRLAENLLTRGRIQEGFAAGYRKCPPRLLDWIHARRRNQVGDRRRIGWDGMTGAAVGASENEAARALGIRERELLRDHPAHRDAEDMRARRLRMIEHGCDIGSHVG